MTRNDYYSSYVEDTIRHLNDVQDALLVEDHDRAQRRLASAHGMLNRAAADLGYRAAMRSLNHAKDSA